MYGSRRAEGDLRRKKGGIISEAARRRQAVGKGGCTAENAENCRGKRVALRHSAISAVILRLIFAKRSVLQDVL